MMRQSSLIIRNFELTVHLGWPLKERKKRQIIHLDMTLAFAKPPKACQSDRLDDTLCYDQLITYVQTTIIKKKFSLIEHLSYDIYCLIKHKAPKGSKIMISITKYPKITGLKQGVSFRYGDHIA